MINEKKISKSGSITIPSHIRRELVIESRQRIKINVNDDGDIVLKRVIGSCIICHSNANRVKVDDKYVCKNCIDKINDISK